MSTDLLRAQANERVDLVDWLHLAEIVPREQQREITAQLFLDPSKSTRYILDGFAISASPTSQVKVTQGRAILAYRDGATVYESVLTTEGDAEKIVSVGALSNATYGIYIRFEYLDTDLASRVFWGPTAPGAEFTQTVPTRRQANWSMRLETTSPGAEWEKIGEAVVAAGVVTGTTDQRDFYFEGPVDGSYASGWSSDGGGVANDRSSDRQQYGVFDFQTFTAAMRQSLEDIKGRGLRKWYERDIGGMNLGFDAAPVEDRLQVGSASTYLDGTAGSEKLAMGSKFSLDVSGGGTLITFDTGDTLNFDFANNNWEWNLNGLGEMVRIGPQGLQTEGGVRAGDITTTTHDNDFAAPSGGIVCGGTTNPASGEGIFAKGIAVGYDANPADDAVTVGDANFGLVFDVDTFGNPGVLFEPDAHIVYYRTPNAFGFHIPGTQLVNLGAGGLELEVGGMIVGFSGTQVPGRLQVGTGDFNMHWDGTDGFLYFDSATYFTYDRSAGKYIFRVGGVDELVLNSTVLAPNAASGVGLGTVTEPFDDSFVKSLSVTSAADSPATTAENYTRGKNNTITARGSVSSAAALGAGHWNVNATIGHGATGVYVIALDTNVTSTASVIACLSTGTANTYFIDANLSALNQVTVRISNASLTPSDADFSFMVIG